MTAALWLEMSRDPVHGAGSWGLGQCLWSPSRKRSAVSRPGSRWPFWETLLEVQAGDSVLHLRGTKPEAAFVGFSRVEADGFETSERPPIPGQWGYATRFYRVPLRDYTRFPQAIPLQDVFLHQEERLRDYFHRNKLKAIGNKRLFYVVQAEQLQCLKGAYLSEVDDELAGILLGPDFSEDTVVSRPPAVDVGTGECIQELRSRVGQTAFSRNVRRNCGSRCGFPECSVAEDGFLVGAHIARWVDAPELRGSLSNGLCLCLMHDRAFEAGYFTITADLRVAVNVGSETVRKSAWCSQHLMPYHGQPFRCGDVVPSEQALRYHWERIGVRLPP